MGAAVPETAVKKKSYLQLRPTEIRRSNDRIMASPTVDSKPPKQKNHLLFGACITARFDCGHVTRSSCLIDSIHSICHPVLWDRFHEIRVIPVEVGILR